MYLDSSRASRGLFALLSTLPTKANQFSFRFHFRKANPLGQTGSWCPAWGHVLPQPGPAGVLTSAQTLLTPSLRAGGAAGAPITSSAAQDRRQGTAERFSSLLRTEPPTAERPESSPRAWATLSLSPRVLRPICSGWLGSRSPGAGFP